jgi:WD40 repeat protein
MDDDGRNVLVGTDQGAAILCATSSARASRASWRHGGSVSAVALSADDEWAVTASREGRVKFWNVTTGTAIGQPIELKKEIFNSAFSRDGKLAVVSGDDGATLCDVKTGQPRGKMIQHGGYIRWVAFGPDSKIVATGSDDHTARIWDALTGEPISRPLDHPDRIEAVALSPDGRILLTACVDGSARMWDTGDGRSLERPLRHNGGAVNAVAFSNDGLIAFSASSDRTARMWDRTTGKPRGHVLAGHEGLINRIVVSGDGQLVATASFDRSVRLWDASLGLPVGPPLFHPGVIYDVKISRDGGTVLTVCEDGIARLWEITRPGALSHRDARRISALTGLTMSDQGEIQLLDTSSWQAHRAQSIRSDAP